jgi:thioredoxin-related protein
MTKLLVALFATFSITSATWKTDFIKAQSEAKQSHKLMLLSFSGSDWCGPCIRLHKEIFGSEEFQKYAVENLVLVNADFPRLKKNQLPKEQVKQNEVLAEKYNKTGKFPFTVLLDENGKVVKEWEGLPKETPEQFVGEVSTVAK